MIINIYTAGAQKLSSYYISQVTQNLDPHENISDFVNNISEAAGTHYAGNIEYLFKFDNNRENIYSQRISNPEGYHQGEKWYYFRRDHLGNNREVWNADNNQTVQITNYYPSGLPWYDGTATADVQPYKYNGKEFVEDYGLDEYDSQARMYYPAIARTTTPDPHAENYYNISPYAWVANRFTVAIDPTGMDSIYLNSAGQELWCHGNDPTTQVNFVVKTTQTTDEMYGTGSKSQKGNTKPITTETAETTEKAISLGNIEGDHMKNVVKLQDTKILKAMLNSIKGDNTGGTSNENNREYGGRFGQKGIYGKVQSQVGVLSLEKSTLLKLEGTVDYHSHPSGNRKLTSGGKNYTASWQQPPSKQDISVANGYNYVVGMGSGVIYIYNRYGVVATIPISTFK
jgi:RHS repeat-associated protein